jgi:NAD(P)-dependent dehydrogenase (short-subunit alcohol dehydrogenase family)
MMKRVLLIFGANGALGKGTAKVLTKKDFSKIYLFGSKPDELPEGSNIEKIKTKDLSFEKNVIDAFLKVKPLKDSLFFLYSTVGGYAGGKNTWESEADELEKMLNINFKSNFFIAKYFSIIVKESAGGSICFTAAQTGINPSKKNSAYGSSKAALIHFVKTLALEGKEIRMTANAISPFIIDTPANREWMQDADYEKWVKPEEIGELVNNLFSSFNFITGNIITITDRFQV